MPTIEIYTQPWCPYCSRVVNLMQSKGAPFKEINAPGGSPERDESNRRSGRTSVPQVFIDGTHIGGCDDLLALDRAKKLDGMLQLPR